MHYDPVLMARRLQKNKDALVFLNFVSLSHFPAFLACLGHLGYSP